MQHYAISARSGGEVHKHKDANGFMAWQGNGFTCGSRSLKWREIKQPSLAYGTEDACSVSVDDSPLPVLPPSSSHFALKYTEGRPISTGEDNTSVKIGDCQVKFLNVW